MSMISGTTATLDVPGATLHYQVRGSGPVLLMICGGIYDADLLADLAERLATSSPSSRRAVPAARWQDPGTAADRGARRRRPPVAVGRRRHRPGVRVRQQQRRADRAGTRGQPSRAGPRRRRARTTAVRSAARRQRLARCHPGCAGHLPDGRRRPGHGNLRRGDGHIRRFRPRRRRPQQRPRTRPGWHSPNAWRSMP